MEDKKKIPLLISLANNKSFSYSLTLNEIRESLGAHLFTEIWPRFGLSGLFELFSHQIAVSILDSFSCKTFIVLCVTETDEKKWVLERHTQLPNYSVNWIWRELERFMTRADTRVEGEAGGFQKLLDHSTITSSGVWWCLESDI